MSSSNRDCSIVSSLVGKAEAAVAAGNFSRAELLLRSADALEMSAGSTLRLADALADWGRDRDAEIAYDDAWERAKASGKAEVQRDVCLEIVRYSRDRDDFLRARQFEQLAIRLSLESDAEGLLDGATLLSKAVGELLDDRESADARQLIAAAVAADAELESAAGSLTAVLEAMEGDYESAGPSLYSSYREHRSVADRSSSAADLFFMGHILRLKQKFGDAAVCYAGAAETWEALGQIRDTADAARAGRECRRIALAASAEVGTN